MNPLIPLLFVALSAPGDDPGTSRFGYSYIDNSPRQECVRLSSLTEPAAPRLAQADRVPAHTFNAACSQVGPH